MQAPAFNPSGNGAGGAGDDGFADEVLVSINVRDWARTESARSQMTHISEPVEVACFSRSGDRQVAFGSRAGLQKFQDPRINVRLDDGFHRFVPKDEREGSGVEEVVSCLRAAGFSVDDEADIVTYRNNLNKIGGAPYNHRDPFEFDAVRVGRTCFVDIRKLEERPPSERHRRFMYMGYNFEALCSAGVHEPAPVNANSEFCAAMRIRIANHRIVLMAEIDAELPSAGGEPDARRKNSFIELKTTRRPLSDRDRETLYLKKYQQWCVRLRGCVRRALWTRTKACRPFSSHGRLCSCRSPCAGSFRAISVCPQRLACAHAPRSIGL
jgi:hypothetical protein